MRESKTREQIIVEDLQQILKGEDRYAHACYKEKLGVVCSMPTDLSFTVPDCENYLVDSRFNFDHLQMRSQYMIFEDNCHEFMEKRYNIKDLYNAALKNSTSDDHKYHLNALQKNPSREQYFVNTGMEANEATACAYVISYYTGINSEKINRGASLVARHGNGAVVKEDTSNIMPILYYMVKALSVIPYYWGCTNRKVQLTDEELKDYRVGDIICWTQFSSSNKGNEEVSFFQKRNTLFKIYSLTGRNIQHLSNFPNQEDEVLYLPMSCFLVLRHETQTMLGRMVDIIFLRQIELGISQKTILWVDDKILDPDWENKKHMESASTRCVNQNIHFIPKTNTHAALMFLKSPFGRRLAGRGDCFRIVSDMTRLNESPPENAGARFFKMLRELGFENKVMIFTSDKAKASEYVRKLCGPTNNNLFITTRVDEATRFLHFE